MLIPGKKCVITSNAQPVKETTTSKKKALFQEE
jgi:hypothetical protein